MSLYRHREKKPGDGWVEDYRRFPLRLPASFDCLQTIAASKLGAAASLRVRRGHLCPITCVDVQLEPLAVQLDARFENFLVHF